MQKAICECCKKEFTRMAKFTGKYIYCSNKCRTLGLSLHPNKKRKGEYKVCPNCQKSFYVLPGQLNTRIYCSYPCANESYKNRYYLNCKVCSKEYERPKSQVKWRGTNYCSTECQNVGASIYKSGENSPGWKGGISYQGKRIRKNIEWKTWRKSVFERDNYTCKICNDRSGKNNPVELHPHHIKSFSKFHELRFDVNNGITLCVKCHHELHKKINKDAKTH